MIVKLIDGTTAKWAPHLQRRTETDEKSSYHLRVRKLLKEIYPTMQVIEEVMIPIKKGEISYLDFFIPLLNIAVEVQGQQHFKFSPVFHSTYRDFLLQKLRDKQKKAWLSLNGIELIEILYNEDDEKWKNQLSRKKTKIKQPKEE